MNLLLLALIGILESVVMLERYRSANKASASRSALSAALVCGLRLAWLGAGVSAIMAGVGWFLAACCYVLPAAIGTYITHRIMERGKRPN